MSEAAASGQGTSRHRETTSRRQEVSKPKIGRRPWQPTKEQRRLVQELAAIGVTLGDIAKELRIDRATLRDRCREDLDIGRQRAAAELGPSNLLVIAMGRKRSTALKATVRLLQESYGWPKVKRPR